MAGINSLGRGQGCCKSGTDLQTIAQTMGPEAIAQYINPTEVVKRLAAAQGIDVLNLVKSYRKSKVSSKRTTDAAAGNASRTTSSNDEDTNNGSDKESNLLLIFKHKLNNNNKQHPTYDNTHS